MRLFVTGGSGFIGTNFLEKIINSGHDVCNFDIRPPLNRNHIPFWKQGTILDPEALRSVMADFKPDVAVHLAARADTGYGEMSLENDYRENIEGTANFLSAAKQVESVKRLVVTSSQFVVGPGDLPKSDSDFRPHTVYGESKVITEKLTRDADLRCWTLIRPTNIWGPYHERYSREFWKVASKGLYLHPGLPSPTRSYGYVGNIVWQLEQILNASVENVNRQVFYLGDRPIRIEDWIKGFYQQLSPRKKILTIPYFMMRLIASGGDLISMLMRKPFYINSSRLKSMTTDYLTPMEKTFDTFGDPPYSLEDGIRITSDWYKSTIDIPYTQQSH